MGKITVIRITENYSENDDIFRVMRYACSKKGAERNTRLLYWGTCGLPRNLDKAVSALIRTQEHMGKASGRRINHIIISFPESITDEKLVFIAADALAKRFGEEYPLIYGVHQDTDHLHIHFAMNTISYKTGRKFHTSKSEFKDWTSDISSYTEEILADWGVFL